MEQSSLAAASRTQPRVDRFDHEDRGERFAIQVESVIASRLVTTCAVEGLGAGSGVQEYIREKRRRHHSFQMFKQSAAYALALVEIGRASCRERAESECGTAGI